MPEEKKRASVNVHVKRQNGRKCNLGDNDMVVGVRLMLWNHVTNIFSRILTGSDGVMVWGTDLKQGCFKTAIFLQRKKQNERLWNVITEQNEKQRLVEYNFLPRITKHSRKAGMRLSDTFIVHFCAHPARSHLTQQLELISCLFDIR